MLKLPHELPMQTATSHPSNMVHLPILFNTNQGHSAPSWLPSLGCSPTAPGPATPHQSPTVTQGHGGQQLLTDVGSPCPLRQCLSSAWNVSAPQLSASKKGLGHRGLLQSQWFYDSAFSSAYMCIKKKVPMHCIFLQLYYKKQFLWN